MTDSERIFSGIQPTGRKHLGNYIGAIRQYVEGQDRGEGDLLHRRPARDHRSPTTRPSCASGSTTRPRSCSPPASTPSAASSSASPTSASTPSSAWLLSARSPPTATSTACTSSRRSPRSSASWSPPALFFYPVLMAADVLAYRADRGAGRRRPAPARRADARDRPPLQRALRRRSWSCPSAAIPRSGRGSWTCRTRARRCRPPAAPSRAPSTSSTSPTRCARSSAAPSPTPAPRCAGAPDKAGITNLIDILAVVRGVDARGDRARVRGLGLRRLQGRRRRGGGRVPGARCASATPSCAPTRRRSRRSWPPAPRRRARSPRRPSPRSATRMGIGPRRANRAACQPDGTCC